MVTIDETIQVVIEIPLTFFFAMQVIEKRHRIGGSPCLSSATLQAVLTMGLSVAEMNDHVEIIKKLKERCNAGRNRHVWRQIFAGKKQLEGQAADDWLCELRICINVYMYVCVYKGFSPFRAAS